MAWVTVAVGGMQAINQIQQGRQAGRQADLAAMQSDFQAQQEEAAAMKTAALIRRGGRQQVGAANAAFAGAGVAVGQGSAAEVEREINLGAEQDAFAAILDGSRRASGLRVEGVMTREQGRLERSAGVVNAVGTMLSTGERAYSRWNARPRNGGDGLSQGDRRKMGVY